MGLATLPSGPQVQVDDPHFPERSDMGVSLQISVFETGGF